MFLFGGYSSVRPRWAFLKPPCLVFHRFPLVHPRISAKDREQNGEKPDLGGGSPFPCYRKKVRKI